MTQSEMLKKIQDSNGRIMNIVFTKKDGTRRSMNCRLGVKKGVTGKGMRYYPILKGLLTVFDMNKNAFRTVNLQTIERVKVAGKEY